VSVRVVMLCQGNICRSPMAEAVFQDMVDSAGLSEEIAVDSAGTSSWHVGELAHPGTRAVLRQHNLSYAGMARQIQQSDLSKADTYIFAMDDRNLADFRRRFGEWSKLYRLLDFAEESEARNVPDPYYSGGFDYVYRLVEDGCHGALAFVCQDAGIG